MHACHVCTSIEKCMFSQRIYICIRVQTHTCPTHSGICSYTCACIWAPTYACLHLRTGVPCMYSHSTLHIYLHPCLACHPGYMHRNVHACTLTNTGIHKYKWVAGPILGLKKTCECIKNVGHIGQIIKVRSAAVGLLSTLSGPPVLGCAQRGGAPYIWGRGTLLQ